MKAFVAALLSMLPLLVGSPVHATASVWLSAFDNTSRLPTGLIDQTISPQVLSLPLLRLRFYRIDAIRSYIAIAPYLGLGHTLQQHFAQSWSCTGFETDNYKFLSLDTGSR